MAQDEATPESACPKTKLEEQATSKGELSYSAWASSHISNGTSSPPPPRKLTEEEAQAIERRAAAQGASAWNHAGTFEERNMTKWAEDWLKKSLKDLTQGTVTVHEVENVSGDANIFFVRGKKRCGFDFSEIKVAWTAKVDGVAEVKGTCKLLNASSDDLDELQLAVEVSGKQASKAKQEADAVKAVNGMLAVFRKQLEQLLDDLKEK